MKHNDMLQAASQVIGELVSDYAKKIPCNLLPGEQVDMTTFETVILGIVSSLIATLIFLYLSWLVKNILLPWFEDKIYRGVRINGDWVAETWAGQIPSKFNIKMLIEQKADIVTGTYSHSDPAKNDTSSYTLTGEIRNAYVTASIWPIAKDYIDAGSFVLRVMSVDGLKMKGMVMYISNSDGNVLSTDVVFKKKEY
jgi:hypothetical protein